jgi:hypothetical protein
MSAILADQRAVALVARACSRPSSEKPIAVARTQAAWSALRTGSGGDP